jgi:hypothetical protein
VGDFVEQLHEFIKNTAPQASWRGAGNMNPNCVVDAALLRQSVVTVGRTNAAVQRFELMCGAGWAKRPTDVDACKIYLQGTHSFTQLWCSSTGTTRED